MTALGTTFLSSSVSMGIITAIYLLLVPFLRRRYRASSLYAVWLVLALGFLIPFRPLPVSPVVTASMPVSLTQPVAPLPQAQPETRPPAASTASATVPQTQSANPQAPAGTGLSLGEGLFLLWLLGALMVLFLATLRHARFARTVKRWQTPVTNPSYLHIFAKVKEQMGITKSIPLLRCPSVGSPMLTGLARPVILLPDENLAGEELTLVLAHELTHCRRRDLLARLGLLIITSLHWFNPMVWLLTRSACFDQESSCDEAVTKSSSAEDRLFYSETIIRVIRRQTRQRTAFSTTFYGGKNGLKRRILSIMNGGKRLGALVGIAALVLTLSTGIVFGIEDEKKAFASVSTAFQAGDTAYIDGGSEAGTRLLTAPTANDWDLPMAVYMNGTPVTVLEMSAGGHTRSEWKLLASGINWARVAIEGDGLTDGFQGWVPVCFLSATPPAGTLPTAAVAPGDTGHVNLFRGYSDTTELITLLPSGTELTVLGQAQNFLHVRMDQLTGFVPMDSVLWRLADKQTLSSLLPHRINSFAYRDYQQMLTFDALMAEKTALYGTDDPSLWPLEGKAWYSEICKLYGGGFDDMYCLMPGEGDLQEADARRIAWDAFAWAVGLETDTQDQYDFNLTFFTRTLDDPSVKRWNVKISPKGAYYPYFEVELDNSGDEGFVLTPPEEYLSQVELTQEERAIEEAFSQWQAEKGLEPFWSLEDKAAFAAAYPGWNWFDRLPSEGALPQEEAVRIARENLMSLYAVPEETLDTWKISCSYWVRPEGVEVWIIGFHDPDQNHYCLTQVEIDAFTTDIRDVNDPYTNGNG